MATSVSELDTLLDALEADLPHLVQDHPQVAEFCVAFIARADAIEMRADAASLAHVRNSIDRMLARHGTKTMRPPAEV